MLVDFDDGDFLKESAEVPSGHSSGVLNIKILFKQSSKPIV